MDFVLALGYFTALTGIFLARLLPVWNSGIPGGLQDTRLFLWNAWWFHYALSVLHTNPFHTQMLFHPFGTSLISHDFPLWMNLITHIGQRQGLSMIAASNVWFGLSWILAGFCTYGLVREITGQSAVGFVAGTFVMTHSYLLARAMQNWGQFNIYGIPLFLWCLIRARRRSNAASFAIAGAALAWTAACHYYFLIYSVLIWIAVAIVDLSPYRVSLSFPRKRALHKAGGPVRRTSGGRESIMRPYFFGLATIAGILAAAIAMHPSRLHVAGIAISMQTAENPVFLMWILLMAWGATYIALSFPRKRESMDPRFHGDDNKAKLRNHFNLIATATLLLTPLFWASFKLILAGGYPKQSILWKTHNSGANLFAFFFPNPIHAIWGPAVSQWYASRGMIAQEQAASIGWVCLAVILLSRFLQASPGSPRRPPSPIGRGTGTQGEAKWLALALTATVLAMGTHLHIAQYNLWCPLPFFGFRLVPILGNVRIPERWMAVGAIAWSVVLAMAVTKLAAKRSWSLRRLSVVVTALILIENWPGIPIVPTPPVSTVYEHLRLMPPGAVLTVPLYIGDSSIGTGDAINGPFIFPWDHLWAQIAHQKPIVGGYIGRISHRMIDNYKADPFVRTLLDLEEHKIHNQPAEPAFGEYAVRNLDFRYVLLYPESTDPEAQQYVLGSLPLELVDKDASIQLYRINPTPSSPTPLRRWRPPKAQWRR